MSNATVNNPFPVFGVEHFSNDFPPLKPPEYASSTGPGKRPRLHYQSSAGERAAPGSTGEDRLMSCIENLARAESRLTDLAKTTAEAQREVIDGMARIASSDVKHAEVAQKLDDVLQALTDLAARVTAIEGRMAPLPPSAPPPLVATGARPRPRQVPEVVITKRVRRKAVDEVEKGELLAIADLVRGAYRIPHDIRWASLKIRRPSGEWYSLMSHLQRTDSGKTTFIQKGRLAMRSTDAQEFIATMGTSFPVVAAGVPRAGVYFRFCG